MAARLAALAVGMRRKGDGALVLRVGETFDLEEALVLRTFDRQQLQGSVPDLAEAFDKADEELLLALRATDCPVQSTISAMRVLLATTAEISVTHKGDVCVGASFLRPDASVVG